MFTESFAGGTFFSFAQPLSLSDEIKNNLLEKWEAANDESDVNALFATAEKIASPKAFIIPTTIDEIGTDYVLLNGIRFDSTLLVDQLASIYKKGEKIYFFTNTCGMELHEWATNTDDILLKGVADDICLAYLGIVNTSLREYVHKNYFPGKHFSTMNPGSLAAWNIHGQVPTFKLLGEGAVRCGVSLGDSMLMTPFKSGSGVYFETEHDFESCMFCDKLDCPSRRAPFMMQYSTPAQLN